VSEALKVARQDTPDLILSDAHLPQLNGFQFLEAIREDPALRAIPFILMLSAQSEADLNEALVLGATKVLIRPIEPELLIGEIERCLGERN
jgi:CheY-like chemotaxis protein